MKKRTQFLSSLGNCHHELLLDRANLNFSEHFEEAMKYARRSVSDADIRRYEMFAQVGLNIKHMLWDMD